MNLNTVIQRIPYWFKSGQCFYLTSAPGVGKTTTVARAPEIIEKRTGKKIGLVIINGGLLTPMDALGFGLPKHYEGHSEMIFSDPFFWRTKEGKRLEEYPDGGIIFVDEADKMDVDVKKAIGEMALSGRCGPHRLPPNWVVWMAGNRAGDRSGSSKELDHLINRRWEVPVIADLASWNEWADEFGVTPLVKAFANSNPQIVFTQDVPEKQGPWCTPRSLVMADEYLRILAEDNGGDFPDDPVTVEEITGSIGVGAASQLFAFVKLEREMPKFERIVTDPTKAKVPDRPDAQMLVAYNLAHRVAKETAEPVVKYMERMPKEFAITFLKAACKRLPALVMTPAFQGWAKSNSSLMVAIGTLG